MRETVTVILTCYNRSRMTLNCIRSIAGESDCSCFFIVVDDGSTDDTQERLKELKQGGTELTVLKGNGGLFYSGGMRKGIEEAKKKSGTAYYLIVNDDVVFLSGVIDAMIREEGRFFVETGKHEVLIGCTCSDQGELTYGGIRYTGKGIKYQICSPKEREQCDTFNANCVLIPGEIFFQTENIDPVYIHSLGDFDYGLSMSKKGIRLCTYDRFVGTCNENSEKNTWMDKGLGRIERLRAKEGPKGAPFRQWFYYLRKNFGLRAALVHGFTPYIRILLGR